MYRVLLIDGNREHAEQLSRRLQWRGLMVSLANNVAEAKKESRTTKYSYEIVILVICDRSRPWFAILRRLQEAFGQLELPMGPLFLCVSRIPREAEFQLQIEGMGARYVLEK